MVNLKPNQTCDFMCPWGSQSYLANHLTGFFDEIECHKTNNEMCSNPATPKKMRGQVVSFIKDVEGFLSWGFKVLMALLAKIACNLGLNQPLLDMNYPKQ